jgi:hypothetical protein
VPFVDETEARKHVRKPAEPSRQAKVKVAANLNFQEIMAFVLDLQHPTGSSIKISM